MTQLDEAFGPVQLAYLAATVLLPARLVIILRAAAEVPQLHQRVRDWLGLEGPNLEDALGRSSNPYAELARVLNGAARGGRHALEVSLERALRKTKQRGTRGQALDAASLLLLLALSFTGGPASASALGPGAAWFVAIMALTLLATMIGRARLQRRLVSAIPELGEALRHHARSPSLTGVCAFCGAEVEPAMVDVEQDGLATRVAGALCRKCGKVVASLRQS
jgi:hypothetical protein